jgi:serine/threonine protein kinase
MSPFSSRIRDFLAAPDEARRLGPYRCKVLLDKAGSAPVYRAVEEHGGLNLRDVAVKIFDIGASQALGGKSDAWQARVMDEARALCRVQHPNVIRFHTISTDPKRGLMGLVMEFVEGVSFDRQLADVPAGDPRRVTLAVEVGIDIASALSAAHEAGVVHCNVKPSNIMLSAGTHKLINFGIAATMRPTDDKVEASRRASFLPEDMPPESIGRNASTLDVNGDDDAPVTGTIGYVDPVCLKTTAAPTAASDLYSIGATLYQCLAGDVPALAAAKKAGRKSIDRKVLLGDAPPAPIEEVAPSTPPELAKLVDALVAPTREGRPRSADAVQRALERIRSALAGRARALPPEERGPFPGLERYEATDRDVFFGRSAEVAGVLELARSRGLVGIVGISGIGKSSITRAGILPAIEEGALGGWPRKYRSVLVTPGADLMGALDAALSKVLELEEPLDRQPQAIAEALAADVDAKGEGIAILVDQLEEIVTKYDPKHAKGRFAALDLLTRLSEAHVGVRVIVVVRSDLLDGTLAIDPHFSRALSRGIQLLGPLTGGGWEEVLDHALEAYGYRCADADLRKDILAELAGRASAMTLAQFGLARMWAARDEKEKTIPPAALRAKGGMRSALEEHAEQAIQAKSVPLETLRQVVLAMTTPEGGRGHAKLDALVERHGAAAKECVLALTQARLVVAEKEGFTFVHDSLLRDWALVRGWLDDARGDRVLVAQVERDAARWEASHDAAELWRKGRLAAAVELWRKGDASLSPAARNFLAAGASEEKKAERARFGVVLLVVSLIVGGALFYAKLSRDGADEARKHAEALAAALAEVKALKQQAEETAGEAAATAALLHDLQKKMADERAAYAAQVDTAMRQVATAKSLDSAQKATADLKTHASPAQPSVPLVDLAGLAGPKTDAPGALVVFDQASLERVVNSRKAGVKRSCLERSTSTASTTKVTATITIAPNGSVSNVATAGDDPPVAKCIEQKLRTWAFPPPGDEKQVQIPFVFVRQ